MHRLSKIGLTIGLATLLAFILCQFLGCTPETCYWNSYTNIGYYPISVDTITPYGFEIDSGGYDVDTEEIDQAISRAEQCLQQLIDKDYELLPEYQCLSNKIRPLPIQSCIRIKIVEPVYSKCSEWHFLKELAPWELCEAKGIEYDEECPCRWRWAVQDDSDIITPPGHEGELYLWDLIKIHTGCNNYWTSKELSKCAQKTYYGNP